MTYVALLKVYFMGRQVGGGFRMGEHMCIHGSFMSRYAKNHYNIVK